MAAPSPSADSLESILFKLSHEITILSWCVLTDPEKEILADIVDARGAAANAALGLDESDELAYGPEDRWWRSASVVELRRTLVESEVPA